MRGRGDSQTEAKPHDVTVSLLNSLLSVTFIALRVDSVASSLTTFET